MKMNSEKSVFKGLKWVFSFFVGVMGIAAVGLLVMAVLFNLPTEIIRRQCRQPAFWALYL